jgi:D-alanyl-D-alanine carboxypeptidase
VRNTNSDSSRRFLSSTEDIPVAERSYSTNPQAADKPFWALRWVLLFVLTAATAAFFLVLGPLRGLLQPPPVPGLQARLTPDGRLLGHFPYPEAKASQLVEVSPGHLLRPDAAKSFLAMTRAAAADGVELALLSAYRPIDMQRQLFFDVKADRNQTALDRAKVSAPPGFSEHSTGYAFDIGDQRSPQFNLSVSFTQTNAYQWLRQNAARYQFILSFPKDNPQGVSFEPWHWRFEGSTEALQLFEPAQRLARQQLSPAPEPAGR